MLLILYLHKHQWHIMVFINKIVLTFNMHGRVSPGTEIFIGGLMTVNLPALPPVRLTLKLSEFHSQSFVPRKCKRKPLNEMTWPSVALNAKRSGCWCLCFRLNRNRLRKWGPAYYEPVKSNHCFADRERERERERQAGNERTHDLNSNQ